MAVDSRQCVVTLPAHELVPASWRSAPVRAPAASDHRQMLLQEVSVWEPIGRVRLASASVNSGAGVPSLSRNAQGDA
jgi:hypothetical protein